MSLDNAQYVVTYTSISSDSDRPSWGITLMNVDELSEMDPCEEVAQQGHVPPLSPTYVPEPMELDEHVPVYIPEPEQPKYHASSDGDIQVEDRPHANDASPTVESPGYIADSDSMGEDDDEDLEEDPSKEPKPEDNDEYPEEDPNEEPEPEDKDPKEEEPKPEDDHHGPEQPEYHAPSDDDIQVEDHPHVNDASPTAESPGYIADSYSMGENDDEDPSEEHEPEDDDEDPEKDLNEESKPEDEDTKDDELSEGSDEAELFEENETDVTPPPPRHRGERISVRP
nr:hypothetical protein [Tanacetum cinerariifolium]